MRNHSRAAVLVMWQINRSLSYLCCSLQASQRLVQLAFTVLERFSQGSDTAAEQQQQPQLQQRPSFASAGSGSYSSKAGAVGTLVPLAPPSVVYAAFAPLVVSTLKVGCLLPQNGRVQQLKLSASVALLVPSTWFVACQALHAASGREAQYAP